MGAYFSQFSVGLVCVFSCIIYMNMGSSSVGEKVRAQRIWKWLDLGLGFRKLENPVTSLSHCLWVAGYDLGVFSRSPLVSR